MNSLTIGLKMPHMLFFLIFIMLGLLATCVVGLGTA
tara:strand:- start:32272 stop:32379 length:108 start_codon:yes stop_codon:yes gene_type:complete